MYQTYLSIKPKRGRDKVYDLPYDSVHLYQPNDIEINCILNEINWKSGVCNCPYFSKNFNYQHLLALSSNKNIRGAIISSNEKEIPLGQKRKRNIIFVKNIFS